MVKRSCGLMKLSSFRLRKPFEAIEAATYGTNVSYLPREGRLKSCVRSVLRALTRHVRFYLREGRPSHYVTFRV
ncbi:MAG: hypothetical protein ACTS5F_01095 [Candidatus Hodgkinia cicadicola]